MENLGCGLDVFLHLLLPSSQIWVIFSNWMKDVHVAGLGDHNWVRSINNIVVNCLLDN